MSIERRPGMALLLSGIVPGLGQVYNAQLAKGLLFFVLLAALPMPLCLLAALRLKSAGLLAFPPIVLLAWVAVIVDAYRTAKRNPLINGKPYLRRRVFIPMALLSFGLSLVIPMFMPRLLGFRLIRAASSSLEPAILAGDYLFCGRDISRSRPVGRGDVVAFEDEGALRLGVILGLEGERPASADGMTILPRIPTGCLLALMDSPHPDQGGIRPTLISSNALRGRAKAVLFSYEPDLEALRFMTFQASGLEKLALRVEDWKRHLTRARWGRVGTDVGRARPAR